MKKVILTIIISQFMVIGLYAQFGTAQCVSCKGNTVSNYSGAIGVSNTAIGENSFASGTHNSSTGDFSTSLGSSNIASGNFSFSGGEESIATQKWAFAFGQRAKAGGFRSFAQGMDVEATGTNSVVMGRFVKTTTASAIVFGNGIDLENYLVNNISNSLMIGFNSNIPTFTVRHASGINTVGKIGIGTFDPSELLEVNGTFKVNNMSYMNNIDLEGSDIINIEDLKGEDGLRFRGTYSGATQMMLTGDGKIGIGTTTPSSILHIEDTQSSMQLRSLTQNEHNGIFMSHSVNGGQFEWFAGTPQGDAGKFVIASQVTEFHDEATAGIMNAGFVIEKIENPVDNEWNVGIGTSNFQEGYILTINGKVISEDIKVVVSIGSDFVFADGYNLPKLEDVEKYIEKNKHLPEIPSADEMKTNGLEIGDMQIKLLQKVEELTLYMIEQQKMISKQQEQIEKQNSEIKELKEKMK